MTIRYFAMVRRTGLCGVCDGTGDGGANADDDLGACEACGGSGEAPERIVLHRDGKLYDEPGKASGSAKRDGLEPVVYQVDTDECEPVETRMSLDEKIGHAEAKYIYWSDRLERLRAEEAGQLALHRHDPKLTAGDWEEVRVALANRITEFGGSDKRFDLYQRLTAKVHLDRMDAEALERRARLARVESDWAAGKGSRRCLRIGEVDALGMARTACGDSVPGPATTPDRALVACAGCDGALARQDP